jgi:hypothetical protein
MKKAILLSLGIALTASVSAFAVTLPADCVPRSQAVAAAIPGDDGTYSKPSDVGLSDVTLTGSGVDSVSGIPYSNYSVAISVAGFTGSAELDDSAGSCYIYNFKIKAP